MQKAFVPATETSHTRPLRWRRPQVLGSLKDGWSQQGIVRDFAQSRCKDLPALHTRILDAFIAAQPQGGWPILNGTVHGTKELYIARYTTWHVLGAIRQSTAADETAAQIACHERKVQAPGRTERHDLAGNASTQHHQVHSGASQLWTDYTPLQN